MSQEIKEKIRCPYCHKSWKARVKMEDRKLKRIQCNYCAKYFIVKDFVKGSFMGIKFDSNSDSGIKENQILRAKKELFNLTQNLNPMSQEKEIKEKLDKILKIYLVRTIAVNQFGLREKLLELSSQEKQKERNRCLKEHSFKCCQILREEKQKWIEEIEKEIATLMKNPSKEDDIAIGILNKLKSQLN